MANDTKELIRGWCSAADDVQLTGERTEPDAEYVLTLSSEGTEITASLPYGRDRLFLTHSVDAGEDAAAVEGDLPFLEEQRPGPVSVARQAGAVRISTWIVVDGLTKHSLLAAVADVVRTRRAVLRLVGGAVRPVAVEEAKPEADAQPETPAWGAAVAEEPVPAADRWPVEGAEGAEASTPAEQTPEAAAAEVGPAGWPASTAESSYQPSPAAAEQQPAAATPASETAFAGAAAGGGAAGSQGYDPGAYGGGTASAASPAPAGPAAWTPGHKVPPPGMQAWAAPDPNGQVIATLGGHLPVQVTEMRGAWAHVLCSNGWTGWVDGRLLVAGP